MNSTEILEFFKKYSDPWGQLVLRDSLLSEFFPKSFTMSGGPNLLISEIEQGQHTYPDQCWVCQPCLRYWDIENVGDPTHLSFFEMVACSSFRPNGRRETIKHIVDFLTQTCGIPLSRIYATVFEGGKVFECGPFAEDELGIEILRSLGIDLDHIYMVDRRDGFVANESEPVGGYKVELYIDLTGQACNQCNQCNPSKCNCGRFLELVTHVAYMYNISVVEGVYTITHLENLRMYATGFGVERLELVLLGKGKKIQNISRFAQLSQYLDYPETDKIRFIDIITALVFLYTDGAGQLSGKNNSGRRWVLNKWLKALGKFDNWEGNIRKIAPIIIQLYSDRYPELNALELDKIKRDTNKLVDK
jgi:alanyl-tRNA synthetase